MLEQHELTFAHTADRLERADGVHVRPRHARVGVARVTVPSGSSIV
jgi:hypothetical protein